MDFRETEEQQMLREAVDGIASKYGHGYFTERARTGGKTDELWDELAAGGYLGVNVPEEYGGGGMGISELAIVLEQLDQRLSPSSPRRLPRHLRHDHRPLRVR